MATVLSRTMQSEDDSAAASTNETGHPSQLAPLPDDTGRELVQLFKLLADETRLRILYFLVQREELNVRTLCDLLDQSQPAVSHHLALLRVAGIIECRRDGKHNFYHVVPKRFQTYLDTIFSAAPHQARKIRVEDAVLTYSKDGEVV
jgi:ArsR family transcriptional regulator, arsenate/arsenite/antimonite-responsive transcriptional repressor